MTKFSRLKAGCAAFFLFTATAFSAPTITLSKKIGPPTSEILVSGSGFEPNVGVDIYFDTKDEALVVTNNYGEFRNAKIHASKTAHPGEHWVTAQERNNDKGDQEPFVVNTNWSQFHFSPDHDGFNPYENVLNAENVHNLNLKWSYTTPYRVDTSPAIKDGVLFVGTVAQVGANYQQLYALDASTGAFLWTFGVDGGGFSDPAVSQGRVYVSARTNLYALGAKTGNLAWSFQAGNGVSTPTVADGMVYASSEDGNLYAIDAHTGTLVWQYPVGFNDFSSPAIADGVLYVGSYWATGKLYALDAKTGSLLWVYTGDATGTSPAVYDGVVYAGGAQNYFALSATTGILLWTAPVQGGDSSPAVVDGIVFVGGSDNNLYALNAVTGVILWKYATGGAVGSPAVANGVVYVESYDDNVYILNAQTGSLLWTYRTGDHMWAYPSPAVANGVLYFGSLDGNVYAFALSGDDALRGSSRVRPNFKTLQPDLTLPSLGPRTQAIHKDGN